MRARGGHWLVSAIQQIVNAQSKTECVQMAGLSPGHFVWR